MFTLVYMHEYTLIIVEVSMHTYPNVYSEKDNLKSYFFPFYRISYTMYTTRRSGMCALVCVYSSSYSCVYVCECAFECELVNLLS